MIKSSILTKGQIGIAGHIGIGHANSHSGVVADDAVGFAVLTHILQKAYHFDITVTKIEVINGSEVQISLKDGGIGKASCHRGFTKFEEEILQRGINLNYSSSQTFASHIFGRIYGHGICDQVSATSLAHARAIIDTIRKKDNNLVFAKDNIPNSEGEFLGGVIEINNILISWLLSINCGSKGTGPNEDSEGIIPIGNKGEIIKKLGMDLIPTIVIDGKLFIPKMQYNINDCVPLIRWNNEYDNPVVGKCLVEASECLGLKYIVSDTAYPRDDSLEQATKNVAKQIIELGEKYHNAKTSATKVELAWELVKIASQDIGGSLYMSNSIFEICGSGGLWPGYAAMLSFIVSKEHLIKHKTITLFEDEAALAANIVVNSVLLLNERLDEAKTYILERAPKISPENLFALSCPK